MPSTPTAISAFCFGARVERRTPAMARAPLPAPFGVYPKEALGSRRRAPAATALTRSMPSCPSQMRPTTTRVGNSASRTRSAMPSTPMAINAFCFGARATPAIAQNLAMFGIPPLQHRSPHRVPRRRRAPRARRPPRPPPRPPRRPVPLPLPLPEALGSRRRAPAATAMAPSMPSRPQKRPATTRVRSFAPSTRSAMPSTPTVINAFCFSTRTERRTPAMARAPLSAPFGVYPTEALGSRPRVPAATPMAPSMPSRTQKRPAPTRVGNSASRTRSAMPSTPTAINAFCSSTRTERRTPAMARELVFVTYGIHPPPPLRPPLRPPLVSPHQTTTTTLLLCPTPLEAGNSLALLL